jgi:signal transduction histidine kinase
LLHNATEHGATTVTITAERRDRMLRILVADNGLGISPGNRDHIFEPFFTTRRESGGTGMGLQIVRSMLTAHGGTIALLPSGTGAVFEIRVPLA